MRNGLLGVLAGVLLIAGCSTVVSDAILRYHAAAAEVQLGMERDAVLLMLEPTQATLPLSRRKPPEQFFEVVDGQQRLVEIYFYRSRTNGDGLMTDDEFMPYVFHDGKLAAIGWTAIGGPKTQAQPTPEQHIHIVR